MPLSRRADLPPDPNLHYQYAVQEQASGRLDAAIALLDAALRLKPDFPEALCLGGFILPEQGHSAGALALYEHALALKPDYAVAWFNRGGVLMAQGHLEPALESFVQARQWNSADAKAHCNRGAALFALGRLDEAIAAYFRALAIRPNFPEAALNLANAFLRSGRYVEAQKAYQGAIALRQNYPAAFCGLGIALKELGRFDAAGAAFDRALALDPQSPETLSNKGCFDLLLGRFAAGWEGYEHRWAEGQRPVPVCDLRFNRLSDVAGKSLLIVNDHALGDTIQFFRYVLVLAQAGAKVIFAGPSRLKRLLSSAGASILWRDQADISGDFDARIALSSLPRAFAASPANIPLAEGYLAAEPARVAFWRDKIGVDGLKIGLCWQGNLDFRVDPRRSIPLEAMAPLANVPDARLFSLQKGFDVAASGLGLDFVPLGKFDAGPDAFLDTAAIIANLDMVVTCDTSMAHLGGALGRPTWLALKHAPEWRWMLGRADTP
jgi:tetratricopeptide (TPR) repeat protein